MNLAVVCGVASKKVKGQLSSRLDNVNIDTFVDLGELQTSVSKRQYAYDRILISSVVIHGDVDNDLLAFSTFLRKYLPRAKVVLLCKKGGAGSIPEKFAEILNSPLYVAVSTEAVTGETLERMVLLPLDTIRAEYDVALVDNVSVVVEHYELPEPEIKDTPKKNEGFFHKLFGGMKKKSKNEDSSEKSKLSSDTTKTKVKHKTSKNKAMESDLENLEEFTSEDEVPSSDLMNPSHTEEVVNGSVDTEISELNINEPILVATDKASDVFADSESDIENSTSEDVVDTLDLDVDTEKDKQSVVSDSGVSAKAKEVFEEQVEDINGEQSVTAQVDTQGENESKDTESVDIEPTDIDNTEVECIDTDITEVEDIVMDNTEVENITIDNTEAIVKDTNLDTVEVKEPVDTDNSSIKPTKPETISNDSKSEHTSELFTEDTSKLFEVDDNAIQELANLEGAYQEQATKVKVVEKVVEKKIIVNKSSSVVSNILDGTAKKILLVTGYRGSGVTTTAIEIAKYFAKSTHVLFVDADLRNHGVLNYLEYDQIRRFDTTHKQGTKLCKSARAFENCALRYDTNLDLLLSDYGVEISDDEFLVTQSVVTEVANNYSIVVVDVPFEYLHLCEDLLLTGIPTVCMEATKRGIMNTLTFLESESSNLGMRYKRAIVSKGSLLLTRKHPQLNLDSLKSFAEDIVVLDSINWLEMPMAVREKAVTEKLLSAILEG